jgi:hypothetical protein
VLLRHTVCLADKTATPIQTPLHHPSTALFLPLLFHPARSFISHSRPATVFITAYGQNITSLHRANHPPRHLNLRSPRLFLTLPARPLRSQSRKPTPLHARTHARTPPPIDVPSPSALHCIALLHRSTTIAIIASAASASPRLAIFGLLLLADRIVPS